MRRVNYNIYQRRDAARMLELRNQIAIHRACMNDHIDKGRKAAEEFERQMVGKLTEQMTALEDKIIDDRRAISAAMLKSFMCAYMAYVYALEFESEIKRRTGSIEDELHQDMRDFISVAKEIALTIDTADTKAGKDHHMWSFNELTDRLEGWFTKEVGKKVNEIMDDYTKTKEFDKLY